MEAFVQTRQVQGLDCRKFRLLRPRRHLLDICFCHNAQSFYITVFPTSSPDFCSRTISVLRCPLILFFPLLIAIMMGSARCNTQSMPAVSGKIALSEGWKPLVYLVQPRSFSEIAANYSGVVLDSAVIATDGLFEFSKVALSDEKALFQICIQRVGNRFPNQLLDDNPLISNYMPVVLQKGEPLVVGAEAARFQATFSIKNPSAGNLALLELRDIRHQAYEQHLLGKENHADENALLEHEEALRQFRLPLMAFADSSTLLWPALVAVRWVSPTSDFERVPEFLFGQCQKWSGTYYTNLLP